MISGFGNGSAEKIGFRKRIFCFMVGFSGKNKSAGAGNRAAADSVQSSKIKFLTDSQTANLCRRIAFQPFFVNKAMFAEAIKRSLIWKIGHRYTVVR